MFAKNGTNRWIPLDGNQSIDKTARNAREFETSQLIFEVFSAVQVDFASGA